MLVRSFERSFDFSFVRLFVRLLIRLLVCFFVCLFSCFFHFLALNIDANIARHSRKEVVNHIKKHPRKEPKVLKMVAQRGPGSSVLDPKGTLDHPSGLLGSDVARQCPPGRCVGGFRGNNQWNSVLIFDLVSGCFFDRCWNGFGSVLGDFLVPKSR